MPDQEVPAELVDAIVHGRCVAFVGAGFSVPTVPPWKRLLLDLVEAVLSVDDALAKLAAHDYDLVISHFGWKPGGPSNAEALLGGMRTRDLRAPVIVFASGHEREANRRCVLRLGALAYADSWSELFTTMERLFADGDRVGRRRPHGTSA